MTKYREILRLKNLGLNHSQIAESTAISRPTIIKVLKRAAELEIGWPAASTLSDRELSDRLNPPAPEKPAFKMPDYAYVHREMSKDGVTLQLLWYEYFDQCRDANELPYQLTQFKKYYRDYVIKTKATMHICHKPGEIMEVDWAGQTINIINTDNGEPFEVFVFVAALPYSGYAYTEAFPDQKQDSWIAGHVNAYAFFGGVTRILVPDNLKTGVLKNVRAELILNKAYQEMAEHYGTAVIPARVRKPKDKPTVEGAVGNISSFILAALRNQTFFSVPELNAHIKEKLSVFNKKPFQKKDGSRATLFAEEKPFLRPLPRSRFESPTWKMATVQYNYHVSVDGQFYSVPYEYIKRKVDVRLTSHTVEVFFENTRICSHVRLHGRSGQYNTTEDHMPPNHRQYAKWNGERFRQWASKVGPQTTCAVNALLGSHKVEQQGYRSCMALLKLSDKYSPSRLEAACAKALQYSFNPSFKSVGAILKSGRDKTAEEKPDASNSMFGLTRGADYYGKEQG
jgi:transposase